MAIEITNDRTQDVLRACAEAIYDALDDAGAFLADEAADELENSPRRVDTSRLKNNISHVVDGATAYVGTNVEYAIYVHEGTRRMSPNHFLANAFSRNEEQVRQFIIDRLENA